MINLTHEKCKIGKEPTRQEKSLVANIKKHMIKPRRQIWEKGQKLFTQIELLDNKHCWVSVEFGFYHCLWCVILSLIVYYDHVCT